MADQSSARAGGTFTHRDLAEMLGVSETTVKSYRRKFPGFIPVAAQGKPLRFTARAVETTTCIRDCFQQGFSVEETRKVLTERFPELKPAHSRGRPTTARETPREEQTSSNADLERFAEDLANRMGERMAKVLEDALSRQRVEAPPPGGVSPDELIEALSMALEKEPAQPNAIGAENLAALRDDLAGLARLQRESNERMSRLQESVADFLTLYLGREDTIAKGLIELTSSFREAMRQLPQAPSRTTRRVRVENAFGDVNEYVLSSEQATLSTGPDERGEDLHKAKPEEAEAKPSPDGGPGAWPDADFLSLPLVIRTEQGEYLGLAGKLDPQFSLQAFSDLLESRYHPPRHFTLSWNREGEERVLLARQTAARGQSYTLRLRATTTNKGNAVVHLHGLEIEGREVPPAYLYTFIKQVKELAPGRGA